MCNNKCATNANCTFCAKERETAIGETAVSALWRVLRSCEGIFSFTVTIRSWNSLASKCLMPSQKSAPAPLAITTATTSPKSRTTLFVCGMNVRWAGQRPQSMRSVLDGEQKHLFETPHSYSTSTNNMSSVLLTLNMSGDVFRLSMLFVLATTIWQSRMVLSSCGNA